MANKHNASLPKSNWLTDEECQNIIDFYLAHCEDGYRRCAYMMIDANIVWAAPSTVYKILCRAGVIRSKNNRKRYKGKGDGFEQPIAIHEHWHIDITYVKINRKHCFLTSVIDGCSRYIIVSRLTETMKDSDIGIAVQIAQECFPGSRSRIISDNGSQFISKEFQEFIGLHGFTHVKTSPYYPQSNGKIERWHKSLKGECIRHKSLTDLEQAQETIDIYIAYYNQARLHSAIGYITPFDMLNGRQSQIHSTREEKLRLGREKRKNSIANFEKGV